jgi:iduronate 2-sulfatase
LVSVLNDPSRSVKEGAFTQHPRAAYYDRTPSKKPNAMGVSVRTAGGRYTEWREWKSGKVLARELYLDADEPAETRNVVDDRAAAEIQKQAQQLLAKQFPATQRP